MAHQAMMNVFGQNIANVNTPGYTRQVGELTPSAAVRFGSLSFGTGVDLAGISRKRDLFLDREARRQMAFHGERQAFAEGLSQLEALLNEPSEHGLGSVLDGFFDAWNDLANNPEDLGARRILVEEGRRLAGRFRILHQGLQELRAQQDLRLEHLVIDLDGKLEEVASLNGGIRKAAIEGDSASALRDRRDVLLEEIVAWTGAQTREVADGSVVVTVDGQNLVEGGEALALEARRTGGRLLLVVLGSDRQLRVSDGEIGGLLRLRDTAIPQVRDDLDRLAANLAQELNRLHAMGPSGLDFFSGSTAADLQVAEEVARDPSLVNVGTTTDAGQNDVAGAIAALRQRPLPGLSGSSPSEFWTQQVTRVGSMVRRETEEAQAASLYLESLEARRDAVSGVNMEEELVGLVTTEKAFQAAARYLTAVNGMLDELMSL
jgi:flagellar hook-associated protein 1 FlgK